MVRAGAGAPVAGEQAERAFERLTQCALAALQHNLEDFEPWLAPWLRLVLDAALLAVDAAAVRAGRTKRRVALVRRSRRATCESPAAWFCMSGVHHSPLGGPSFSLAAPVRPSPGPHLRVPTTSELRCKAALPSPLLHCAWDATITVC